MGLKRYEDKSWKESMKVTFDYSNMMSDSLGKEHGISQEEIRQFEARTKEIHKNLIYRRKTGSLPFFDLPYKKDEIQNVISLAEELRSEFTTFVGIGIGGSALGNITLQNALKHPYYNMLSDDKRGGPKVHFIDNIDPDQLAGLLDILDLEKTVFNAISKSGETAETMSSFLIFREKLIKAVGKEKHVKHIVVTTDKSKGILRRISQEDGYRSLVVPDGVGGRFSVLTPVGLLSAAVAGIDIQELAAGAAYMDERLSLSELSENMAYRNAVLHYISAMKGKNISVMMPYSRELSEFAAWYSQLWAESLGKRESVSGENVYTGQTPVKAVGATDQHSQIQLYVEGPFDKVITFLKVEKSKYNMPFPEVDYPELKYFENRSMKNLFDSEIEATAIALTNNGRANCKFSVPQVNPFTLGQLIYLFEVQTAFSGGLYQIDAFDQPGVEAGKQATYALMGREGFEKTKIQIEEMMKKRKMYVLN